MTLGLRLRTGRSRQRNRGRVQPHGTRFRVPQRTKSARGVFQPPRRRWCNLHNCLRRRSLRAKVRTSRMRSFVCVAAAALAMGAASARAGGSCLELRSPTLDAADSLAPMGACADALASAASPNVDDVHWLAVRARRAREAGYTRSADAAVEAVRAALRSLEAAGAPGVTRIDQPGDVIMSDCLPIWRLVEHDRKELLQGGERAEKAAQELRRVVALAGHSARRSLETGHAAATRPGPSAPDNEVLDSIVEWSKKVDCDSTVVRIGKRQFDLTTHSDDERFALPATGAALHGWTLAGDRKSVV